MQEKVKNGHKEGILPDKEVEGVRAAAKVPRH
jgi:hypothetical protein